MIPRMWICPDCNQLVPSPLKGKCPNGHALWDGGILSPTREQSVGRAFIMAAGICLVIAILIVGSRVVFPEAAVGHVLGLTLVAFIVAGIVGLLRGLRWKRKGGPASRLAPRAFGMALGCILAGGGLLAIGFALGLAH
ncbi:MAG: hypothetical protein WCC21_12590 [Candidatus Acidiferrales bacterium]